VGLAVEGAWVLDQRLLGWSEALAAARQVRCVRALGTLVLGVLLRT